MQPGLSTDWRWQIWCSLASLCSTDSDVHSGCSLASLSSVDSDSSLPWLTQRKKCLWSCLRLTVWAARLALSLLLNLSSLCSIVSDAQWALGPSLSLSSTMAKTMWQWRMPILEFAQFSHAASGIYSALCDWCTLHTVPHRWPTYHNKNINLCTALPCGAHSGSPQWTV